MGLDESRIIGMMCKGPMYSTSGVFVVFNLLLPLIVHAAFGVCVELCPMPIPIRVTLSNDLSLR